MLSFSFGMPTEAAAVEKAVARALADGLRTADLVPRGEKKGKRSASTREFADAVASAVES
jgi:3-isopropylmalate dehydrogenase